MLGARIGDLALDLREERDVSSRLRTSSVSRRHLDIYQNLQPQHTYTALLLFWSAGRSVGLVGTTPRTSTSLSNFRNTLRPLNPTVPNPSRKITPLLHHLPPHFEHFPPFWGNPLAPARSLPAHLAQTTHPWPDDVRAISVATNFIMQIINISQNRTKYATTTTTNNFFHTQLTAATRYTQRTTTNTAPIPSPPTPVWPLIFFLHLTLLHFTLSFSLSLRCLTFYTLCSVHDSHQHHRTPHFQS